MREINLGRESAGRYRLALCDAPEWLLRLSTPVSATTCMTYEVKKLAELWNDDRGWAGARRACFLALMPSRRLLSTLALVVPVAAFDAWHVRIGTTCDVAYWTGGGGTGTIEFASSAAALGHVLIKRRASRF